MVTTGERLAVDGFGPRRRAFERELAPHELPAGACEPPREADVVEEPRERPRPRGGVERRGPEPRLPPPPQIPGAPPVRRPAPEPPRPRPPQRLRGPLHGGPAAGPPPRAGE